MTDRCNFRCVYCMPREIFGSGHAFLERKEVLTFEEVARLAAIFAGLGVGRVRLTGGEPLLRRDVERLVAMLASIPGLELALTTNGSLLAAKAAALKAAGLSRVTVSLDSLDDREFRAINDVGVSVDRVLSGIDAAAAAGLDPIKINMVVKRGTNDQSVLPMARRFHGTGHILRFVEYMDVGGTNGWRREDVVPAAEIISLIHAVMPLEPVPPRHPGEVARRWRYLDGGGEIGVIASVTAPFCSRCTRARLSASGSLYACLFASSGEDLRRLLRDGSSDEEIAGGIRSTWAARSDAYSEMRARGDPGGSRVEMSFIGG